MSLEDVDIHTITPEVGLLNKISGDNYTSGQDARKQKHKSKSKVGTVPSGDEDLFGMDSIDDSSNMAASNSKSEEGATTKLYHRTHLGSASSAADDEGANNSDDDDDDESDSDDDAGNVSGRGSRGGGIAMGTGRMDSIDDKGKDDAALMSTSMPISVPVHTRTNIPNYEEYDTSEDERMLRQMQDNAGGAGGDGADQRLAKSFAEAFAHVSMIHDSNDTESLYGQRPGTTRRRGFTVIN